MFMEQFCLHFADVRTQAMYQLLDSGFIGLIFSCFSEDNNKVFVLCLTNVAHHFEYVN